MPKILDLPVEDYLIEYCDLDKEDEEKYWNNRRKNESTTSESVENITEDKATPTVETSNSSFWSNSETRDENELNNNEAAVQNSIDTDSLNQLDVYKNEEKIFYEKPKLNIQVFIEFSSISKKETNLKNCGKLRNFFFF